MDKSINRRAFPVRKVTRSNYHRCIIQGCNNLTQDSYTAHVNPAACTAWICTHCAAEIGRIAANNVISADVENVGAVKADVEIADKPKKSAKSAKNGTADGN